MSPDRIPEQQLSTPDQTPETPLDRSETRPPLSLALRFRLGAKIIENAIRHPSGDSSILIDRQAGTARIEPDPPRKVK